MPYFHVVFTLPAEIASIAFQNKKVVYNILCRTAAETLGIIAADPKHLGAGIGLIAVLHSWGQTLSDHPHLHCIVPGGGPSSDGTRWVACRPNVFLPVRVLSHLFRRLSLQALRAAFEAGQLQFFGDTAEHADPKSFTRRLTSAGRQDWVVYATPPFGGPEQVLANLTQETKIRAKPAMKAVPAARPCPCCGRSMVKITVWDHAQAPPEWAFRSDSS